MEAAQLLTRGGRGQGHGPVVGEGTCLKLHVLLPGLHLHLPLEEHRVRVTNSLRRKAQLRGKKDKAKGEGRVRKSRFQSPEALRCPDPEVQGWPLGRRTGKGGAEARGQAAQEKAPNPPANSAGEEVERAQEGG